MRSPDDVFQELESDRLQREAELRLLENIAARATTNRTQYALSFARPVNLRAP